jgi:AI-2 transport protein TqsA
MVPLGRGRRPRLLLSLASLVIVVAGLKAAAPVVSLFIVSAFISMISAPVVFWLQRKRVPAGLSVLAVVFGIIGVFAILGVLVGTSANAFVRQIPVYRARLNEQAAKLLEWLDNQGLAEEVMDGLNSVEPGSMISMLGNAFGAVGGALGKSFVVIVMVSFILFEVAGFRSKLQAAFGESTRSVERVKEIAGNVERYLGLKTMICAVTGIGAGIWCAAIGLDFPLLWGLLAFVLNYIPTFGSIVAAIPPVALALVQFGVGPAVVVLLGYLLVNLVMGNLVEPRVMGYSMGLSPFVVFISLLAWGFVLGVPGMFMAVPLTMALKIVMQSNKSTEWIAVLMGSGTKKRPEPEPETASEPDSDERTSPVLDSDS